MSGTSLDGVDAVLADFSAALPQIIATHHIGFDPDLRAALLALNQAGDNELARAALAANALARHYAAAVNALLATSQLDAPQVAAIGCHGQTVRHRPDLGYTLQLNNPALLVELTGISVAADFRSRDIAAGGQGAPLVPAFHAAVFRHAIQHRVIVNIGGIANLTNLPPEGEVIGFDCGPGNVLLDMWSLAHTGRAFDDDGAWGASGKVIPAVLDALLKERYFQQPPPKSTGRDLFNRAWLENFLRAQDAPQDVQATLMQLSVETISQSIKQYCAGTQAVYVCGGGARNGALMQALRHKLAEMQIALASTDALGVGAEQVEALAFAWLARQTCRGAPGNLPTVTGAKHLCLLGALYPAGPRAI